MYKKVQDIGYRHHFIPVLTVVIMASYQNTSEYYCDITENTHSGYYPYPNLYYNQNPTNFHTHAKYYPENYKQVNPKIFSGGSIYSNENVYRHIPQYNTVQYTPFTQEPVPGSVFQQEPRHHAQITILPSSKCTFKAQMKRKRKRTMFTTEQVEALEYIFQKKQYVSRKERQVIMNKLQLSDKTVKKFKSTQNSEAQEECFKTSFNARLDAVEFKIRKNTDKEGIVTLDDVLMRDLVSVIDLSLSENISDTPVGEFGGSDSSSLYEPVSPASVRDSNEEDNSLNWSPPEPDESLKSLFDLQTMFLI